MAHPSRIAVCAGSFDPITNGHLDLIARASRLFDTVVVGILVNPGKQSWFTAADRVAMVREAVSALPASGHVEVETFNGLLVDFVRQKKAAAIVRGLRSSNEFAEESQRALMNRHLSNACETVFLVSSVEVAHISSRLVKEIAAVGGPLTGLVPPVVIRRLAELTSGKPDRVV